MELNIGSNIIRNTSGVLNVEGQDQIFLEIGKDGQLLLTMDVYDQAGTKIAKLHRNADVRLSLFSSSANAPSPICEAVATA